MKLQINQFHILAELTENIVPQFYYSNSSEYHSITIANEDDKPVVSVIQDTQIPVWCNLYFLIIQLLHNFYS